MLDFRSKTREYLDIVDCRPRIAKCMVSKQEACTTQLTRLLSKDRSLNYKFVGKQIVHRGRLMVPQLLLSSFINLLASSSSVLKARSNPEGWHRI